MHFPKVERNSETFYVNLRFDIFHVKIIFSGHLNYCTTLYERVFFLNT